MVECDWRCGMVGAGITKSSKQESHGLPGLKRIHSGASAARQEVLCSSGPSS